MIGPPQILEARTPFPVPGRGYRRKTNNLSPPDRNLRIRAITKARVAVKRTATGEERQWVDIPSCVPAIDI